MWVLRATWRAVRDVGTTLFAAASAVCSVVANLGKSLFLVLAKVAKVVGGTLEEAGRAIYDVPAGLFRLD
jgi:hypothetical protein